MNILIVGLGEVGSYLAKVLSTEGHAVTIVDTGARKVRRITTSQKKPSSRRTPLVASMKVLPNSLSAST